MLLKDVIEALVFASQKPLSIKEILAALRAAAHDVETEATLALAKTKEPQVAELLQELRVEYTQNSRAFQLVEQASGWAIVTRSDYGHWVRQLYPESRPTRLSGPSLETLAVIAYRQPVTRADIEAVRGVAVDGVMQSLLDRGLIRIAGRAELPGRPLLYETTQIFMEHFGLKRLEELPNSNELRRIQPAHTKAGAKKSAKVTEEEQEPTEAEPEAQADAKLDAEPDAPDAQDTTEEDENDFPEPEESDEHSEDNSEEEELDAYDDGITPLALSAAEFRAAFEADYGNDFDPEKHTLSEENDDESGESTPFPL